MTDMQLGCDSRPAPTPVLRSTATVLGLACVALACGCTGNDAALSPDARQPHVYEGEGPIRAVCTTGQVAEMVRRVGTPHVQVEALMGPGVDPHLYSPAASDVTRLSRADAIVYNGLHLEGQMAELFEKLGERRFTLAVTAGLVARQDARLREPPEFAGLHDPHVWHDAALWADCATDVATALARFDPPHAADYAANALAYRTELLAVDEHCRQQIAALPAARRVLITAHDAFGYFGAAYGLEVHGLKGVSTEEEKDLQRQEQLQRMIIERQIPAVFVESAVAPRVVQALVEPVRAQGYDLALPEEPLYADAMGVADSDAATYAGMLRHNVRVIVTALDGASGESP